MKKLLSLILMFCLLGGLVPPAALPTARATTGGTDISEMNALEALGFDTAELPAGVDLDSPDNPYGRETIQVNPVHELFVQGKSASALYGHNKALGKSWDDFQDAQQDPKATAVSGSYAATATASGNFSKSAAGATAQTVTVAAGQLSANGGLYLYWSDPVSDAKGAAKTLLGTDKVLGNSGNQMNEDFASDPYLMQNYLQIATGDFDGDGVDEVAVYVAQQGNSRVEIYDLQLDSSWSEATAVQYALRPEKWAKAWTYYFNESPYVSNMVSLTSGDFNQDGTDDLALTWGYYYGLNNYTNSQAVVLAGAKGSMLQQAKRINLEHGGSQIVRAAFSYGDVDGDNVNDLILGGQLNSDILGGNLNSRFVAIYTYNGDSKSFLQSVAKNFDLFATEKNDAGEEVYIHTVMSGHNKTFYSLPTMVANIAAVNLRGVGYAANIYIDSLILEYGDHGLAITAALDQNSGYNRHLGVDYPNWVRDIDGRFYTEYSAVAADFTGDTAETLQIMLNYSAESYSTKHTYAVPSYKNWWRRLWGIKSWSSVTETLSFSLTGDTVLAGVQGKLTAGAGGSYSFGINVKAASVDFATSFCALNSDNDTSFVSYTSEHGVIYSDPQVLAVLASPPHFADLGGDQFGGSYMESSTSYSSTKGSGSETSKSNTLSIGAYVSYQHDFNLPIVGTKVAGLETELAYTHGWTWETTKSKLVEMTISYETVVGQDSVAFYSIPMEYYVYDSYVPLINETTGEVTGYDLQKMSINLPHTAAVTVLSLDKYERIAADYKELPKIAGNALTHTVGNPASYPSSIAGFSNVLEYDGSYAGVDYSATGASVTQEIAITTENSDSLTNTNTLDFKIGAGPGDFIFGVTAGYEHGSSKVTITSEGSTYAGSIYNMPLEAEEYGYYYAWKLFTYNYLIGNNAIPVVSYLVKDVTAPPVLPLDFAQDTSLTTDEAIGLTWSYPSASAISGFQIYRYYQFADGSGSYELAFVPASEVSYTTREATGGLTRHYQFVDSALASYTNYDYQIQVVRAAVPTASILSDVLTARTKADQGYPTISLGGVTKQTTVTYDQETGAASGSVSSYSLLVYPDTSSTVSVTVAEHYDQAPRYQWQKLTDAGWSDLAGATRASHTFSHSGVADEGQYRCRLNLIYENQAVGQIYYISAYSEVFELVYSLRKPQVVSGGFQVDVTQQTVSLSLKSNHNNHTFAPAGNVTFTISGADYSSSYAVALGGASADYVTTAVLQLGAPGTAPGNKVYANLPAGVYDITAYYGGSRVFSSLAVNDSVYYVSGNSSGHLLNLGSSFIYGQQILPQLMSVSLTAGQVTANVVTENVTYKVFEEQVSLKTGTYTINWPWGARTYTYTYKSYEFVQRDDFLLGAGLTARAVGSFQVKAYVSGNEVAVRNITVKPREITIGFVNALTGVAGEPSISHPTFDVLRVTAGNLVEAYGDRLANLGLVVKAHNSAGTQVPIGPSTDPGLYTIIGAAGPGASANYQNYNVTYLASTYILTGPKYDITLVAEPFGSEQAIVGTVAIIRPEVKEDNGELVSMTTTALASSYTRPAVFTGGSGLTLRAAAQTGYQVKSWTVSAGGTSTRTVTNATTFTCETTANDTVITVEFELAKNRLYFQAAGGSLSGGSVVPVDNAIQSGAVAQPDASYSFLAIPAEGYHFVQWTLAGSTNSNFLGEFDAATGRSRTSLQMGRVDTVLSALFERDSYTLTLQANLQAQYLLDDGFGNSQLVTSTSTVSIPGDTVITVLPRTGFNLLDGARWSLNEVLVGDLGDASHTFTLTEDTAVAVGTNQNQYQVTVSVAQPVAGAQNRVAVKLNNQTIDLSQPLDVAGGKTLSFTAVEAWGYLFSQWVVNGLPAGTAKTLTIPELGADQLVRAEFIVNPHRHTVAVTHNPGGRLTYSVNYQQAGYSSAPQAASLGAGGGTIVAYAGDTVQITAVPSADYMLRSWTVGDAVNQSPPNMLNLSAIAQDITVAARFIPMSFARVTYEAAGDGAITSAQSDGVSFQSGELVGNGTQLVLTAAPGPGQMVDKWTLDGQEVLTADQTRFRGETLTIPRLFASSAAAIKVYFTALAETTVSYNLTNVTVARVYTPATYSGQTASTDNVDYLLMGSKLLLTAAPADGYRITEFKVNGQSGEKRPDGTWVAGITAVQAPVEVQAVAAKLYPITVDGSLTGGRITVAPAQSAGQAIAGELITLTAINPDRDYTWAGWSMNGQDLAKSDRTFSMPAAETSVSASFTAIAPTTIDYSVYDKNGSSVPGGTDGALAATVSRTASGESLPGYPYLDATGQVTARRGYADAYANWPASVVTLQAQPDSGYMTKYWYLNGAVVTADTPECVIGQNQLTLTVGQGSLDNYQVQVQYALIGDKVSYAAGVHGTISSALLTSTFGETSEISSGHTLTIDGTITFTAAPESADYQVSRWYVNGVQQPGEATPVFVYPATAGTGAVIAVEFERVSYLVTYAGQNGVVTASEQNRDLGPSPAFVIGDRAVTFTASAAPGYAFRGWLVNGESSEVNSSSLTLTVTADLTVLASFSEDENMPISYSVSGSGGGLTATRRDADFASGSNAAANDLIVFAAHPETVEQGGSNNYRVASWTVNGVTSPSNQPTYQLVASSPAVVSVSFERSDFVISYGVETEACGSLTAAVGSSPIENLQRVARDSQVTFTATPLPGYRVKAWTVDATTTQSEQQSYVLSALAADTTLSVEFELIPSYTVQISTSGQGYGFVAAVVGTDPAVNNVTAVSVPHHGTVTLTALRFDTSNAFAGWTVLPETAAGVEKNGIVLTLREITGDITVQAAFVPATMIQLTATESDPHGTLQYAAVQAGYLDADLLHNVNLTDTSTAQIISGMDVVITALPEEGYMVQQWSVNGEAQAELSNRLTLRGVRVDSQIQVTFEPVVTYAIPADGTPVNGEYYTVAAGPKLPQDVGGAREIRDRGTVSFTVSPLVGSYFTDLTICGVDCLQSAGSPDGTETNVVAATANADGSYTITVSNVQADILHNIRAVRPVLDLLPTSNGAYSVSYLDEQQQVQEASSGQELAVGTRLTITATPADGYFLRAFGGAASGQTGNPLELSVGRVEQLTLGAQFAQPTVSISLPNRGKIVVTTEDEHNQTITLADSSQAEAGAQTISFVTPVGTALRVTGTPQPGYYLSTWGGAATGKYGGTINLTVPDHDINLLATFNVQESGPVLPPTPPTPPTPPVVPSSPHKITVVAPDGSLTEVALTVESGTRDDGRTLERIAAPSSFAATVAADRAAGSEQVNLSIGNFTADDAGRQPVVEVSVPTTVLAAANGMTLNLTTPHGSLSLPPQLLAAMAAGEQDLVVTIDRQPIETVRQLLPVGTEPIGEALSVETDLTGPTEVTISMNRELPEDAALRQAFLGQLMTFALHSDGREEMIYDVNYQIVETPYLDELGNERVRYTLAGVSFGVDAFSRFVVVKPNQEQLATTVGVPGFSIAGQQREMVACYYQGGDTMMPIRMLEDFGVKFQWNEETKTATMSYRQQTVQLTIGSTTAYINGVATPIIGASGVLVAPSLSPGRTMIPLRFVSEHLGFKVTWDRSHLITIRFGQAN